MTRLLGGASRPGLSSSAANVLAAVRRLSGDRDRAFPGVQRVGDGVLHGVPRSLFGFNSTAPSAHGLADAQQRGLFHGGQYATPMWLARGNPMCHTDVALLKHIDEAFMVSGDLVIQHDKPKGRSCSHRRYQLSCPEYDQLFDLARDRCEICGTTSVGLVVDHDPRLGDWAVRGLLCNTCNSGLHHLRGARVSRYLANPWYRALLPGGDAAPIPPQEPSAPVWDPLGRKWLLRKGKWQRRVSGSGYWHPSAMTWPELYQRYGPRLHLPAL